MIDRPQILKALTRGLDRSRVVVLTGLRQCGKTTLARQLLDPDSVSYFDLEDPASLSRLDEPMTALRPLLGDPGDRPDRHTASLISSNTFALLGQAPVLGRAFLPSDEQPGAAPVAILRYRFWERRFGSDPGIVGRTVLVDGTPTTVVGVMPKGLSFPENLDLWLPLIPDPDLLDRKTGLWFAFGRLASGASEDVARAEMEAIGRRLAAAYPLTNAGVVPVVHTFDDFSIGPNAKAIYGALLGGVGIVLLIACGNLASLMLGRAVGRSGETAVLTSLGAGPRRIVRQSVIESLIVSSLGGALGWLIAQWSLRFYEAQAVPSGRFIIGTWFDDVLDFGMDYRGLAYLCAMSLLAAALSGLVPALRVAGLAGGTTLSGVGRGTSAGARERRFSSLLMMGHERERRLLQSHGGTRRHRA
jgi:hypothetical protein